MGLLARVLEIDQKAEARRGTPGAENVRLGLSDLAGRGYAECRESLLCELNCELTGMAKQFSELSVTQKGVAALLNSRS